MNNIWYGIGGALAGAVLFCIICGMGLLMAYLTKHPLDWAVFFGAVLFINYSTQGLAYEVRRHKDQT